MTVTHSADDGESAPLARRKSERPATTRDRRTHELTILSAVAEALNSAADTRQAMQCTLSLVAELLGFETGWMWLLDPDTGRFYSAAAHNLPPYLQEPVRMTGKPCTCMQLFQKGSLKPKNIDVLECSRLYPAARVQAVDLTRGLQYHASVPLFFRDTPLGIMNVTNPTWRRLDGDELGLLSTIAYLVGIAIDRARLAEESTRVARAEERARIAREIHDTLAQGLTGIALHLEGALNHLEDNPGLARRRLERALEMSRESLEDARRSVLDLRTTPLSKPLPEALAGLARWFTSETGVRARVRTSGDLTLTLRTEAELYRIAQEALANVRRHAKAREVDIALRTDVRPIRLSIRDDGRGFDARKHAEGRHGIVGMRERARLLGGRLSIVSRAGSGTTITAIVPNRPENDE